ncbi:hypothetical protein SEVIR_5G221840v4 [Setaria viridis]|uniref:Amino acid transporter transmembrane domain-containing protein n=1 Tax=Setaria viridis TaxID=4556 RepID=A0A4U6UIH4_SETVI|nr:hypothetical protein SEVIR_5G221840v2 [Setaria viridis]
MSGRGAAAGEHAQRASPFRERRRPPHLRRPRGAAAVLPPHRRVLSRTCLNLTNAVSGIGVLSMPYAVAQGRWLSLALFALVGAICYYTGTLIERCMRADPDAIRSYPDIGEFAFGSACRRAIAFFMYVELYLVAISFLILEGDNLDKLFPGAALDLLGYRLQGKQLFIARWPPPPCCRPRGSRTSACLPTSPRSGSSRRRS